MRPRRTGPLPLPMALALVVGLSGGCGPGDGTAGMSGRQVVRGHDVADLFFVDADSVAFTRQTLSPSQPEPQDLWIYDLTAEAPGVALTGIDWAPPLWWANVRIGRLLETGPNGLLFYDFQDRTRTDLTGFGIGGDTTTVVTADAGAALDPGADAGAPDPDAGAPPDPDAGAADAGATPTPFGMPVVVRRDGEAIALVGLDPHVVGVGAPSALRSFRLPAVPFALNFIGSDVAMIAAPDGADPSALGVYRLAVDSGQWTQIGAPRPLPQWSPVLSGCVGFGSDPCGLFKVVGCGPSDAACPDTGVAPCAIVFVMAGSEAGSTVTYAYDFNAGTGFTLPGQGASHVFVSPDQHLVVWDDSQIVSKRYWDLCTGKKDFCPQMAGPHLLWRSDSKGFATVTDDGALAVANFADNLCTGQPVAATAYAAFYSPSASSLAWLATDDPNGSPAGLWVAAKDGSNPVLVDAGSFSGARFSPDESRMLVSRSASSSVSLAWLDMTVSPPVEHPLVDNYGGFSRMGNRRVLLVDDWNTQDAAGDLTLLDMTTGARTVLGRAVTSFAVSGASVDAAGTNVAYVARSRVASNRDGLWLTTLPP